MKITTILNESLSDREYVYKTYDVVGEDFGDVIVTVHDMFKFRIVFGNNDVVAVYPHNHHATEKGAEDIFNNITTRMSDQ